MTKVYSVCEFLQSVKTMKSLKYAEDEILFFRGSSDKAYSLQPSVFRQGNKLTESDAYHDIMMEYPEQFVGKEHLSNLVKMQHYGLRTRLLDVTRNPLIALYFACEQNLNKDAKVSCFKKKKSEVLHHNSDRALMLACIPAFSVKEQEEIRKFCELHRGLITDNMIASNVSMKRLLHEIRSEFPAFETAIIGEDLLKNYFVATYKDNQRMKVQDGAFVICGLQNNVDDLNNIAVDIVIDSSAKKEILRDLKLLGISSSTVYPDFERTAMAIASDRRVDWVDIYDD